MKNNLLNRKRLIFPPFSSDSFRDFPVEVNGGEITRALLHFFIIEPRSMKFGMRM